MATIRINSLNLRYIKENREEKHKIFMIREIIRIDIDQIVATGGHHSEVEVSTDRNIEEGHNMLILIEMTLGEKISGKCKIIEVKNLEVDIEVITETISKG